MIILAVLLPTAAVVITYLFILEVIKYRSGALIVSPRRFRLRFAAWILALLLCVTVMAAMFAFSQSFMVSHPGVVLGVWSLGLALGIALIWIMLADIQEVEDRLKAREREIWRDLARLLASRGGAGETPSPPENQDPPQA